MRVPVSLSNSRDSLMGSPDAPIFVVGTGRSGTTLMRQMLSSHPKIHLTHEASFYLWEKNRPKSSLLEDYLQGFHYRYLGVDTPALLRGLPQDVSPKQLFRGVMQRSALARGKSRYGDKTPAHIGCLKRIYEDFPDARVVRVVRSPVQVVESLLRMPWFPPSLLLAAALINRAERDVAPYESRVLTVRLEDLIEHPERELRRVLTFVEEPWDAAVLDHRRQAPDDLPPLPWFQRAKGDVVRGGHRPLDRVAVGLVERLCGSVCARHGYMVGAAVPPIKLWARSVASLPALLSAVGRLGRLGWAFSRGCPEEEVLGRLLGLNPHAMPGLVVPEPPPLPANWRDSLHSGAATMPIFSSSSGSSGTASVPMTS